MNTSRPRELYEHLLQISSSNRKDTPFYYIDQEATCSTDPERYRGWKYRIFGYLLTSYSDWLLPDALWSRGSMFLLNDREEFQQLVCLPMQKYFNLNENPLATLDSRILQEGILISEKRDGSLMSTYIDLDGRLRFKSKMSTKSSHCIAAEKLLAQAQNKPLQEFLTASTLEGQTVDLEWTSPSNRVVVGYETDELTILSIQSRATIATEKMETLITTLKGTPLESYLVKTHPREVLSSLSNDKGLEGYVVELQEGGQRVKMKAAWYTLLHKTKERVATPKNLYEQCLYGEADDLKALFVGDIYTTTLIADMERVALKDFYSLRGYCEDYYNQNKALDRKSYAIQATRDLGDRFGLCMNLFLQKDPDYKRYLLERFSQEAIPTPVDPQSNDSSTECRQELVITVGLPGCGKSFFASNLIKKDSKYVEVNRDDLRKELYGKYVLRPNQEKEVTKIQDERLLQFLHKGNSVIVSDTNLNPKTVQRLELLVEGYNKEVAHSTSSRECKIIFKDMTDTPLETCFEQDLQRERSVGKDVILTMNNKYLRPRHYKHNSLKERVAKAILVDIDGTVATKSPQRGHFDWNKVDMDLPREDILELVSLYSARGYHIVFCSGRMDSCRGLTLDWLSKHLNLKEDQDFSLFMRKEGDSRKDTIIKSEIFLQSIDQCYNVRLAIDDRPCVCRLWKDLGLTVLDVSNTDYEF